MSKNNYVYAQTTEVNESVLLMEYIVRYASHAIAHCSNWTT